MAKSKTITKFSGAVAKKVSKTSTGGNITAANGAGLPIVVGVAGLAGKASGLKPPTS